MTDIVQMTGSPERAYEVFVDVVKNLFEWDETTHRGLCSYVSMFSLTLSDTSFNPLLPL